MVGPLIPPLLQREMQGRDTASMPHRVTLETLTSVRITGGEYTESWVAENEQPGRLDPAGAGGLNLSADKNVPIGEWNLSIAAGRPIVEGQRALVRGGKGDQAWQRLIFVTKVLQPRSSESRAHALAVNAAIE